MNRLEKLCLTGLVSLPLVAGTIALGFLSTPLPISCDRADEQMAVSARLQCAQRRAEQQTPEGLTTAIELLKDVSPDDPYREQSERLMERWSIELVAKAEAEFQAGNLEKAVSIARARSQDAKIQAWKSLWEKGEMLSKTALTQTEKREWEQAFQTANQLRQLGNEYWQTEQYNSLVQQIQRDRELRDFSLKNIVEPDNKLKEAKFTPTPTNTKIARSTRPVWTEDDAITPRPLSNIPQRPKFEIKSEAIPQPSPKLEIAPEPPLETENWSKSNPQS